MWQRNRFEPRRGESPEDAFVRLYEERYGAVVSEENADELVIELLDEPSARWIVVGLFRELRDANEIRRHDAGQSPSA